MKTPQNKKKCDCVNYHHNKCPYFMENKENKKECKYCSPCASNFCECECHSKLAEINSLQMLENVCCGFCGKAKMHNVEHDCPAKPADSGESNWEKEFDLKFNEPFDNSLAKEYPITIGLIKSFIAEKISEAYFDGLDAKKEDETMKINNAGSGENWEIELRERHYGLKAGFVSENDHANLVQFIREKIAEAKKKEQDICFNNAMPFARDVSRLELLEDLREKIRQLARQNTYEDNEALVYKTTMNEVIKILSEHQK